MKIHQLITNMYSNPAGMNRFTITQHCELLFEFCHQTRFTKEKKLFRKRKKNN